MYYSGELLGNNGNIILGWKKKMMWCSP